jgi:hypothetical protein
MNKIMRGGLVLRLLVPAVAAALAGLYLACEKEPQDEVDKYFEQHPYRSESRGADEGTEDLVMTPANAAVTFVGEQVQFHVEGGNPPFSWSVANDADGDIDEQGDRDALYTADTLQPNTVVAVDDDGRTAIGHINHTVADLQISPSGDQQIPPSTAANFIASGGAPPYNWSQFKSMGALATGGANSENCTYTANATSGTNVLIVTDFVGDSAQVTIRQVP